MENMYEFILNTALILKEKHIMNIWIVAYFDKGDIESTVTAFDNHTAALLCYETFQKEHDNVSIDEVPLYKTVAIRKCIE